MKLPRTIENFFWPHGDGGPMSIDCVLPRVHRRIREALDGPSPCMITRFGSVEMDAFRVWLKHHRSLGIERLSGRCEFPPESAEAMAMNAGFSPATGEALERYCRLIFTDLPQIDILGVWLHTEERLRRWMRSPIFTPLHHLEPWRETLTYRRWTTALADRRILVVHPFSESILSQYKKRTLLFDDESFLPAFELMTIKAPQRAAGNTDGFSTWFDAYDWLKAECDKRDFDIAIIGAGAFGMPLAAHIKRSGRKAIHLGGITQLLFGIRGRRWEERPDYRGLFNEHWAWPLDSERPAGAEHVESACYW